MLELTVKTDGDEVRAHATSGAVLSDGPATPADPVAPLFRAVSTVSYDSRQTHVTEFTATKGGNAYGSFLLVQEGVNEADKTLYNGALGYHLGVRLASDEAAFIRANAGDLDAVADATEAVYAKWDDIEGTYASEAWIARDESSGDVRVYFRASFNSKPWAWMLLTQRGLSAAQFAEFSSYLSNYLGARSFSTLKTYAAFVVGGLRAMGKGVEELAK